MKWAEGAGGVPLEKTPVSAASLTPRVELLARQETTGSSSKTHLPTTEVARAEGGWQLFLYTGFQREALEAQGGGGGDGGEALPS